MAWDVLGMVNVAVAVYPARERLELLTQLETWVAEQKQLATAQLAGHAGPGVHRAQPRAEQQRRGAGDVLDADFEESPR